MNILIRHLNNPQYFDKPIPLNEEMIFQCEAGKNTFEFYTPNNTYFKQELVKLKDLIIIIDFI